MRRLLIPLLLMVPVAGATGRAARPDNVPPPGFMALFNGRDLTNWQGLIELPQRAKLSPEELSREQEKANQLMREHWSVEDGVLQYDGKGNSLQTAKDYASFELWVDWKIEKEGDSGIYLRGNPQVQIWDGFNSPIAQHDGKPIGSGGLYNNKHHAHDPLVVADNPIGEWNRFHIKMVGDRVTVHLNEKQVVADTPLENYWEPDKPLPARGPIELQHHGSHLEFKNIFIKELP
jgi:hypothetical protein